jgi:hypothetical protein
MMSIIKAVLLIFITIFIADAEDRLLQDLTFPYRIVCNATWVEEIKNDTILVLKNSAPGKKTCLQLKKYTLDTTFYFNNNDWSRLNYIVNKELAIAAGRLIFTDTGMTKKLGNYRAFEMFASFSQKTDVDTIWWSEYSRWTDYRGFGYLASIIGDTSDMKENYASYKTLMDSISISPSSAGVIFQGKGFQRIPEQPNLSLSSRWYTLSGRSIKGNVGRPNTIIVRKNVRRFFIR